MHICEDGDSSPSLRCQESRRMVQDVYKRQLLDRIDMHVEVPSVEYEAMRRKEQPETSQQVRSRVNAARQVQQRLSLIHIFSRSAAMVQASQSQNRAPLAFSSAACSAN